MQIVIELPEDKFDLLQMAVLCGADTDWIHKAVVSGTPLPKGHGKLIDINEITAFRELECNGHNVESLNEFTTIVEADKVESEE